MGRCLFVLGLVSLLYGQPMSPDAILIGRTRYHMIETLRRIPNYTCLETIERSVRRSDSKRASVVDALRLEVAVVDGKELFSWPGERQFKERDLRELAPGGAIGNGNFALHAKSVFGGGYVTFTFRGREPPSSPITGKSSSIPPPSTSSISKSSPTTYRPSSCSNEPPTSCTMAASASEKAISSCPSPRK